MHGEDDSVLIDTCANFDGSSGVCVSDDGTRKKRVWWLRARGCSPVVVVAADHRCSNGDGVSDEGSTEPARVKWWSKVGEPTRLCEKMVVRVEEAAIRGWRSGEIMQEGGGSRGGGRSTERR